MGGEGRRGGRVDVRLEPSGGDRGGQKGLGHRLGRAGSRGDEVSRCCPVTTQPRPGACSMCWCGGSEEL